MDDPKVSIGAGRIRWEDGKWYFYDESEAYRHGPFDNEFDTAVAFVRYGTMLSESSRVEEVEEDVGC